MPRRKTIGKDPFSGAAPDFAFTVAVSASHLDVVPANDSGAGRETERETVSAPGIDRTTKRAVGGRLEILGGDLGTGASVIWRFSPNDRIGFVAPTGRLVDLVKELDAVQTWPDPTEHRLMSAAGTAWRFGSLRGVIGAMAGAGIRLLYPRRTILRLRLNDGSKLVVRTDGVTVAGLEAFTRGRHHITA